jgi:restriction endonuclease S subunit
VKGANTGEIFKGIEGILPPSLASIRCANEDIVVPQYLYYLLKGYEKALMSQAKGSTIKSLVSKTILDLKCWIPTIDEQLRLVSYLDKVIGKIDSVAEVLGNAGNVFSEYRQTLIENVVHGRALI